MRTLTKPEEIDALFAEPLAILMKHSVRCPISHWAMLELSRFQAEFPDFPVHIVDVLASRPLSVYVSQKTSLRHESPQVLVLRHGELSWSGSHEMITARAVARSIDAGTAGR